MIEPLITIAVQCAHFERRLLWMASSLAQQTAPGLIEFNVSYLPGAGTPDPAATAAVLSDRLVIRLDSWAASPELFTRRGEVRTKQLKVCRTEWLMFSDCDMVYCPQYFERLAGDLTTLHASAPYMVSSGRTSNHKDAANELVTRMTTHKAIEVPHSFELASRLAPIDRRNVGAGFCQLINARHCPHGGYYVEPGKSRDWDWTKRGSNPRSDMQFRRRIAAAAGPRRDLDRWFSRNAVHLNHDRDPDVGRHLTCQR